MMGGSGLRTFIAIADAWELTEAQRIAVLGHPERSTYRGWMQKARDRVPFTLTHDALLRISAVLGIYKGIRILFDDPGQGLAWLRSPHRSLIFAGAAPLELIVEGSFDGMMNVRRYLDAWRSGNIGDYGPEGSFTPVTEEDLEFR